MTRKIEIIDDPTEANGFQGMYIGRPGYYNDKPLDFDLHKAARYIRENGLNEVTEDIKKMFPLTKQIKGVSNVKR